MELWILIFMWFPLLNFILFSFFRFLLTKNHAIFIACLNMFYSLITVLYFTFIFNSFELKIKFTILSHKIYLFFNLEIWASCTVVIFGAIFVYLNAYFNERESKDFFDTLTYGSLVAFLGLLLILVRPNISFT